jgi:hypothetical protein
VGVGRGVLLGLLACLLLLCVRVPFAHADSTVSVNTTSDAPAASQCSLRDAVLYAGGTPEGGCASSPASGTTTITLPAGTYTLAGSGLSITGTTIIDGAGAASTTISGGNAVQVVNVAAGVQATLDAVTISGGLSGVPTTGCTGPGGTLPCPAETGNNGGGISNAGTLTLGNSVVTSNKASAGTLPRTNVLIACIIFMGGVSCPAEPGQSAGEGGSGGGIYNTGQLTVDHSTISGNAAGAGGNGTDGVSGSGGDASDGQVGGSGGLGGFGGGIFNVAGATATITASSITGNAAGTGGNAGAGSGATNSSGNNGGAGSPGAGGFGGGIFSFGTLTMSGSTLSSNTSGVGGNGASGGTSTGTPGSSSAGQEGGFGGGLFSDASATTTTTLVNDTVTANTASAGGTGGSGPGAGGSGGGVAHFTGLLQMSFITVADNSALGNAGGIDNGSGGITEADSIVAANTGTPNANCTTGTITDNGDNVVFGDNSCPGANGDPKLGTLSAANGGPTATMALQPGSAAFNSVPLMQCPVASDQRGVGRPQGPACDAGAYEVAPPTIASPAASSDSPTDASVTAKVNPNVKDTTVVVNFGTSTAYAGHTAPQDIGSGTGASSFSANLTGLSTNTTYHYDIVATNGDGTTTTTDGTFKTSPPATARINSASVSGTTLTVKIGCNGGASGTRCSGPVVLTSRVTTHGKTVVGVATVAKKKPKKPKKPKTVTKTQTLAKRSYSMASGHTQTIKLSLNAAGKKLLNQFYRVPARLSITGTSTVSRSVVFSYGRLHISPTYTWAFGKAFSFATELTLGGLPKKSKVTVICRGHGCPFSKRTFSAPKHGKLALASALKQRHLSPHSTVELQITAPGDVGEVVVFTIVSGKQPTEAFRCLVPGSRSPAACASG